MEELFTYDTNKISSLESKGNKVDKKWFMLSPRQSLQVKTEEELKQEFGSLNEVPGFKNYYIEAYKEVYGRKFQNNVKFMEWISQDGFTDSCDVHVFETEQYGYIEIPLSFVKIVNTKKIEEELAKEKKDEKKEESRFYSIAVKKEDKDPKIIEEMIGKVDKNLMEKLFSIGNNNNQVEEYVIDKYLSRWAEAKYEFYLLFGNQLKIEEEREMVIDKYEMGMLVEELIRNFNYPFLKYIVKEDFMNNSVSQADKYKQILYDSVIEGLYKEFFFFVPMLKKFTMDDFVSGKLPADKQNEKYFADRYKVGGDLWKFIENEMPQIIPVIEPLRNISKVRVQNGMKLSKFLSKLFNDDKFDIELSKVLQNRHSKGKLAISINPIDYLVMSMNKHGWSSCQQIVNGCCSSAAFSYMLDETTLVSYIHNGNLYHYDGIDYNTATGGNVDYGSSHHLNFGRFSFDYYSFKSRELIYVDKETCGCAFTLGYCNMSEEMYKTIRLFMEHIISEYLHIEEKWVIARPSSGKNSDRSKNAKYRAQAIGNHVYLDPIQAFAYVKDATNIYDTKFKIGCKNIPCIRCGVNIAQSSAKFCGNC